MENVEDGGTEDLDVRRWSVGSYGPFPIDFFREDGAYYYGNGEGGSSDPHSSLKAAIEDADFEYGSTDGGFWKTEEEADKHADWMRENGYGVE